jgi:multiple sugar transport system substrate-binding protein
MVDRMGRRDFLRSAGIAASALLLAACQPQVVEVEKVVKETVEVEKVAEKGATDPIRLRFSAWGDVQDKDVYEKIVYEFMQAQSQIIPSVEQYLGGYYEKIIANFAAGNSADVLYFQGWTWQKFVENAQLRALDPFIEVDHKSSWWPEFQAFQEATRWQGQTYMTPTDTSGWVTFYNKDLFDNQGIPYPHDDWTWDDYKEAIISLAHEDGGTKYYSYAEDNAYYFMWLLPVRKDGLLEWDRIVEPTKAQWSQEAIIRDMQFYAVDQIQLGYQPEPAVLAGGGISVYSGRVAMMFDGSWRLPRMFGDKAEVEGGLNYDVALLPKGESGRSEGMPFIHGHVMAAATQEPEASWELLKFILDEQGQQIVAEGGRCCGRPEMIEQLWVPLAMEKYACENAQAFARALEQGTHPIIAGEGGDITAISASGGPLPMARDKMVQGVSAEEALTEMDEGLQIILDKYWEARS